MSTSIIQQHQDELLKNNKNDEAISCTKNNQINIKNEELNTQIIIADSSCDNEKKFNKNDEKIKNKILSVTDWDYDDFGPCGPSNWLKIFGDDKLGKLQSPINLQLSQMKILSLTDSLCLVNYNKPLTGDLVNNGCSIQFLPDPLIEPPEIYGGNLDQNYRFIQYHFHWAQNDNEGSEHCIGGLRYPAELHLVHKGVQNENKLAVLGIFLELEYVKNDSVKDTERNFFNKQEMFALKELTEYGNNKALDSTHFLASKLPQNCIGQENTNGAESFNSSFIRYNGSLTTPPCTENVTWTVFTDPVAITKEQLSLLRSVKDYKGKIIGKNYRPVQKIVDHQVCLHLAS